jgi:hypothetical protein
MSSEWRADLSDYRQWKSVQIVLIRSLLSIPGLLWAFLFKDVKTIKTQYRL